MYNQMAEHQAQTGPDEEIQVAADVRCDLESASQERA
jgi:hypothetical protein